MKERLGDLWPDKGFIEHERYDECKAALREVRDDIIEQLAENDEEKEEYKRYWPFENISSMSMFIPEMNKASLHCDHFN